MFNHAGKRIEQTGIEHYTSVTPDGSTMTEFSFHLDETRYPEGTYVSVSYNRKLGPLIARDIGSIKSEMGAAIYTGEHRPLVGCHRSFPPPSLCYTKRFASPLKVCC